MRFRSLVKVFDESLHMVVILEDSAFDFAPNVGDNREDNVHPGAVLALSLREIDRQVSVFAGVDRKSVV
jgi:hypothetical protein